MVTSGNATVDRQRPLGLSDLQEGFGGAFNEKAAGATHCRCSARPIRDMAMHLLYGSDGARFNLGRIPMGASDYATSRYTEDEVASGSTDYSMTSFSISRDMQGISIPATIGWGGAGVERRHPPQGQPLDPPTWMKTGTPMDSSPFDGENMTDNAQILSANAQYLTSSS